MIQILKMKKIIFVLLVSFLFSSCIVIKVYDTPKKEDATPKLIAKKRMMLPSDRHIPLPNGDKEILFYGEGFPPTPEVFHFEIEDSLVDQMLGDSLHHKGVFILKLDGTDSLPKASSFQWKTKGAMHPGMTMKMKKECCMLSEGNCAEKDSLCASMSLTTKGEKSIQVIKIDQQQKGAENSFVIKTKGGADEKAPLIMIDGVEKAPGFDLQSLSPDLIERIDVLKDKAAFDKVGEKGVNGVILIQLKEQ